MHNMHSVCSTLHRNLDAHPRIDVLQENSFTKHVTDTVAMSVISTFNRWLLATRGTTSPRIKIIPLSIFKQRHVPVASGILKSYLVDMPLLVPEELHPMGHEAEQDYWADIDVDLSKGPQSAWRGGQPSPPIETDTPTESPPLDFQEQFPFDVACCA
ncbi:hypothetical protein Q3G72_032078 [Acer saccharum]|nr:hypothetical protein Q3G72_032078 [Acer saccharum]